MAVIRPSRALVRVFVLLGAAALLSACRVDASVDVVVADDGSGQVQVNIGFDDEALARAGDLRLEDARAAGWVVTGPQKEVDRDASGLQWVHATKAFSSSEQFSAIMNEIGGANGIFRGFQLVRTTGFAKVTFTVTGTIDAARGLESFSDPEVAELLGGNALGRPTADVLKDAANASMIFAVELPGDVKGDADRIDDGRAEWDITVDRPPIAVAVHSDDVQGAARMWAVLAVVLGLAAVAGLVLALAKRPERRRDRLDARGAAAAVTRARPEPVPATTAQLPPQPVPQPPPQPQAADRARPADAPAQKRIQVVVLDAMGVLYRDADDVDALLIPFVREHGGIDDALAIRARYGDATLGRHTTSELWSLLGVSGDGADLDRAYTGRFELNDGVHELLDAMDQRAIAVACLTNDVAEWSALLRRRFGLDDRIRPWIVSGVVGARKPNEAIFRELEHRLDVSLSACLLVDDRIDNLATGKRLGMATVHLAQEPVEGSPYRRVSSLFELFNRGRVTT